MTEHVVVVGFFVVEAAVPSMKASILMKNQACLENSLEQFFISGHFETESEIINGVLMIDQEYNDAYSEAVLSGKQIKYSARGICYLFETADGKQVIKFTCVSGSFHANTYNFVQGGTQND